MQMSFQRELAGESSDNNLEVNNLIYIEAQGI